MVMPVKRRCLVCGTLIFSGFYCADCSMEMLRVRTLDDQTLEDWLAEKRAPRNETQEAAEKCKKLESFE